MMKRLIAVLLTLCFALGLSLAGAESDEPLRVVALKGPTAMGMVKLMSEEDPAWQFDIQSDITMVTPLVAKGEVDIAAVPANVAAVLYNNPDVDVQVLCVNTLGVLYIVENGDTVHSVADLAGRTLYASGAGATPEYALNYILSAAGVEDAQIEWKSEHTECLAALLNDENGIAMLPQPFVTTAMMKNEGLRVALSLTDEWNALQAEAEAPSTMVTGVLIVRRAYAEAHPDKVNAFINSHFNHFGKVVGCHHDIDADDTRRKRTCELYFIPQFVMAHAGCRNEADTAFIGNCCRQTGCGQANRHTALLNGNAGDFIAYFQLWKFQCYSSNQAYLP